MIKASQVLELSDKKVGKHPSGNLHLSHESQVGKP